MEYKPKKWAPITADQITLVLEAICDQYDPRFQHGAVYQSFLKHIHQESIYRLITNEINLWRPGYDHVPKHQRVPGLETFFMPTKETPELPLELLRVLEEIADFITAGQMNDNRLKLVKS